MNRMQACFDRLREKGEKALVGFVTAGDPDLARSKAIITALLDAGVDILELGVPFSDPTADGPAIQLSSQRAIKAGTNLRAVIGMTAEIRAQSDAPIVLFSYYNPILSFGVSNFYDEATKAGADGVLLVDVPHEETDELTSQWSGNDLAIIRLVAPTTPEERMKTIANGAEGFLYLVSMTGVTGSGGLDVTEVGQIAKSLKSVTNVPICVGFGISKPDQAKAVAQIADGVVVGSAFERIIEQNLNDPKLAEKVAALAKDLKEATR